MRVHVNFGKSVFEHSCGGGVGRTRRVKSSVLTAFADAPMRSIVGSTDSSKSVLNAVEKSGLEMSLRQAQEYVRASTSTSWEQFVFELGCLEGFFEQCRTGDTEGEYVLETSPEVYGGENVRAFHRYFVSWGAAKELMLRTDVLPFVVVDGAHMKSAFGGVCLAAVVATANSRIFPLAWAVVDSENDDNCLWFATKVLSRFNAQKFVWMTDQGTALTSDAMRRLLREKGQMVSLCAKHLIKALDIAKAKKKIGGDMKGVRHLIYEFARSRTREWGNVILDQIGAKSVDVRRYLEERRDEIEAAAFLEKGFNRGGRITSQLVESFFGMCDEFRRKAFISGVVWMARKFEQVQMSERGFVAAYEEPGYGGCRLRVASRKGAEMFLQHALGRSADLSHRVIHTTHLRASVEVTNMVKRTSRVVELSREEEGADVHIDCGCMLWQEYGLPCGRAAVALKRAFWCEDGLPAGTIHKWLRFDTWKAQAAIRLFVPEVPPLLAKFDCHKPESSLRLLLKDGPLRVLPCRIAPIAGRPKLVSRTRRFNDHFPRLKSATESSKKKSKMRRVSGGGGDDGEVNTNGDDPEILFDGEIDEMEDLSLTEKVASIGSDSDDDRDEDEDVIFSSDSSMWSLMDNVGPKSHRRKSRAQQSCRSCGKDGHKWPKCRNRSIELMLVSLGVLDEERVRASLAAGVAAASQVPVAVERVAQAAPPPPPARLPERQSARVSRPPNLGDFELA